MISSTLEFLMIFASKHEIRLTLHERETLRVAAREQGVVLRRLKTPAELLDATLAGLSLERKRDLLEFFETGTSADIRAATGV